MKKKKEKKKKKSETRKTLEYQEFLNQAYKEFEDRREPNVQ